MADPDSTRVVERVVRQTVDQLTRRVHVRMWQLGISTGGLAVRMGVSRPRVSQVINGEDITVEMFERLTVALEVDAGWWQKPIGRTFTKRPNPVKAMFDRARAVSRG